MKVIGIIPARYASTRFPGKPLQEIHGKTMINRVYNRAIKSPVFQKVVIATDDQRIFDHSIEFGADVMMTSEKHESGTDRCNEVIQKLENDKEFFDVIVNIQGDEPFLDISQFEQLVDIFRKNNEVQIATLAKEITNTKELFNSNVVKVIFDKNFQAIYFSRYALPYQRGKDQENWIATETYFKHIGIYAYKSEILKQISSLERSRLEISESLEQLRWIENAFKINIGITDIENIAIDIPADLEKFTNNF